MPSNLLLRMEQISKAFPGVQALQSADFELREGEVHALVGENGAGKSTLIKVLAGVHRPDAGTVWLQGRQLHARSPRDMMDVGVRVIYQELNLVPGLSVAENLFLGREPIRHGTRGVANWAEMYQQSEAILKRFGLRIDPRAKVGQLGVAYQQIIEIAKAVSCDAQVVVFDEPTRGVDVGAKSEIYRLMEELTRRGAGIIMISSDLPAVLNMSDRILVVREGQIAGELQRGEATQEAVLRLAVGSTGVK